MRSLSRYYFLTQSAEVLPGRDYKINIVEFDYFGGNS